MQVHLPEMAVHACGEDCKNNKLEVMQHGVVCVMEEQRCEDVRHREQKTTCIVGYVVLQQDNIEMAVGRLPALDGAYECEGHESQCKRKVKKKRYEE